MADIELVIKISEKIINEIKDNAMFADNIPSDVRWAVTNAIVNGTPQEPCKDAISREAVLELQYRIDDSATLSTRDVVNVEDIQALPSVTP